MTAIETAPKLQRPDLGIVVVQPGPDVTVHSTDYPWIGENRQVHTRHVFTQGGLEFFYGSLIRANPTIERIAGKVSLEASTRAEQRLFRALGAVTKGEHHSSVKKIPYDISEAPVLKVLCQGNRMAQLFFTVQSCNELPNPLVLRVGIVTQQDEHHLLSVITARGKKRRLS